MVSKQYLPLLFVSGSKKAIFVMLTGEDTRRDGISISSSSFSFSPPCQKTKPRILKLKWDGLFAPFLFFFFFFKGVLWKVGYAKC